MTKILDVWNKLKEKLTALLKVIKTSQDSIYYLLSSSSKDELEQMKKNLVEKETLLNEINSRPSNQMLSRADQIKYERLDSEVDNLQKEITWQEFLKDCQIKELLIERFSFLEIQSNLIKKDLAIANGKIELLNIKLKEIKSLIEEGDINQLQELVRSAKI